MNLLELVFRKKRSVDTTRDTIGLARGGLRMSTDDANSIDFPLLGGGGFATSDSRGIPESTSCRRIGWS